MTTIRVSFGSGSDTITVTCNLAEASAPICIDGEATQYQTASARHRVDLAVALACRVAWPEIEWPSVPATGSIPADWPEDNCEAWDAMSYEEQ